MRLRVKNEMKESELEMVQAPHFVPLSTRAPVPNDVEILKPKVGLGPNQIEIDLRKLFQENYNSYYEQDELFLKNKDKGNPRACARIHTYAHAYSSFVYACFMHAYA